MTAAYGSGSYGSGSYGGNATPQGATGMNTDLMIVGATGICSLAPVGSTMPTTATSALDAAFIDYGAISDDGATEANSTSWQAFKPWGLTRKAKNAQTDSGKTLQLTFWESNKNVLAAYYNLPTVPTVTSGAMSFSEPTTYSPQYFALVLDSIEGTNHIRMACTKVQITDRGNRVFNQQNIVGYQLTFDFLGSVQHYIADASLT